jgi:hypothetical protein
MSDNIGNFISSVATTPAVTATNDTGVVIAVKSVSGDPGIMVTNGFGTGVLGLSDNNVGVQGTSGTGVGVMGASGSNWGVGGTSDSGAGVVGTSNSNNGVAGSSNSGNGVFGISTKNGDVGGTGVGVLGQSTSNWGVGGSSDSGVGVMGTSNSNWGVGGTSDSGAGVVGTSNLNNGVAGTSKSGNGIAGISTTGPGLWATGTPAGFFQGNVTVTGDITLMGGSDLAEDFDAAPIAEIEPGTVMVLDDDGALRESQHPYDKKVAGVISGADEFKAGLILGRDGLHRDRPRVPVALIGKVYCKVDAQFGAIGIGDLLTTSPTPGHAMRAEDPLKAFGATIGKALRGMLGGEKGLIPILVALQ